MFRDAADLFGAEGVAPDLVRAGEPRLRRYAVRDTASRERAVVSSRVRRQRRLRTVTP